MPVVIDTDVAIHLRDGDPTITARLAASDAAPVISVVTLVELRGGVASDPSASRLREPLLAEMLRFVPVLPFTPAEAEVYGAIVSRTGHNRHRVLDRMIAAQAIVAGLRLVTINGRDFAGIPDLDLEVWSGPNYPVPA